VAAALGCAVVDSEVSGVVVPEAPLRVFEAAAPAPVPPVVAVEPDAVDDGVDDVAAPAAPLLAELSGAVAPVAGVAGVAGVTVAPAVPVADVAPGLVVPVVPTAFGSRRFPAALPGLVVLPVRACGWPASGTQGTMPGRSCGVPTPD
jgi:hypothetical protein